ncbi:SpdA protein [Sphaerisporangium siamense]|uniref:DUF2637 domain-containing protein n=1 Tax=Sphaerisporangium siamense TaxID=795645 RepID=A0A7W7D5N6_9ACTN|nr:DUF2637 domain-containing protein [Sphaerisporangium siamense]MBB4700662.1 hypothetical protein [Sphaerisporangium siamense]GII89571.1 SpdA protein [Sphaerisporangium siamense]
MRRFAAWLADSGPVIILAAIAGAGSFTHIRDTATAHGQHGWMAWAIAICIDLTCVMAARERQRDKKTGHPRTGWASWPTLVLTGGVVLSLAANLDQAQPTAWGWIVAATPAGAFLVAVSMLERRFSAPRPTPSPDPSSVTVTPSPASPEPVPPSSTAPALVPGNQDDKDGQDEASGPSPELLDYARKVATDYHTQHHKPISRDALRARLGVSNQLASDLLRHLRTASDPI